MQTKAIRFWYSAVEFLPVDIFTAFPRLNGIVIGESSLPVLRDTLFNRYFTNLEYLYLGGNRVRYIEAQAFVELIRLKWINLSYNLIEFLNRRIFHNNYKLEYISFYQNKIKMIHPQFFENLVNLQFVAFSGNDCVDEGFEKEVGGVQEGTSLALMTFKLRDCFDNCCTIE
jgi:Leucine-rich repeat (LRR) protein